MPTIPPLTSIQQAVLGYLHECQVQDLHPTYRELAEHFGWRAVATARDHLRALAAKGFVVLGGGRSRNLRITPSGQTLFSSEPGIGATQRLLPNPVEGLAQDIVKLLEPYLHKKEFKAGTYLWHEGDPAEQCIIIDRGQIMAFRELPSGRTVPTCLRGLGEIVGFPPLFDGSGYPTTVQVLADLEARVLERSDLLRAIQDGTMALLMFKLFNNRLKEVFKVIGQLSHQSAVPRVASFLLALIENKQAKGKFTFVTLPLASGTLAKALGIAPETMSRAISQLVSEKVLHRLSVRRYQVLDLERLRQHAQAAERA
jgi:CRP/FNR family transcriptional regulator